MIWSHVRNATLYAGKTYFKVSVPLSEYVIGTPKILWEQGNLIVLWGTENPASHAHENPPKSPIPPNPLSPSKPETA